jgi:hypothetical protein
MVDPNESSAPAATEAAPFASRIPVPGSIVAPPAQIEAAAQAPVDAGEADLDALISRERSRHAEARAGDAEPLADARGARVCCVLCFNRSRALPVEDAG